MVIFKWDCHINISINDGLFSTRGHSKRVDCNYLHNAPVNVNLPYPTNNLPGLHEGISFLFILFSVPGMRGINQFSPLSVQDLVHFVLSDGDLGWKINVSPGVRAFSPHHKGQIPMPWSSAGWVRWAL
jgi:hypothetical protein